MLQCGSPISWSSLTRLMKLKGGEDRRVSMRTHVWVPAVSGRRTPATVQGTRTAASLVRPLNGSMPFRPTPPARTRRP